MGAERIRTVARWTVPLALTAACAVLFPVRPPALRTSLYDMVDGDIVPEALRGRSEQLVPVIVSADDAETARAAAADLAGRLEGLDGASVRTGAAGDALESVLEAMAPRRAGLASAEDAELLATPEGRGKIARAAARRYYASPLPPLFPPETDPFCLADRFVTGLPRSFSGWTAADGALTAERGGKTYVLVVLSIGPEAAAGAKALETFAARLGEVLDEARAAHPGAEFLACGAPLHTASAAARCRREIGWLSAFSLAFIAGLSLFAFRSAKWIPLLAASLATAAASGGLALLLGFGEIHVLALVFGTTVLGLVIDYSFHWLMAEPGRGRATAVALAASFATTEIGLVPLMCSSLPVLRQTAAFLAAGLAGALAYVLLCYPRQALGGAEAERAAVPGRGLARVVAVAVLLVSAAGWLRVRFGTGLDALYRPPAELAAAEQLFAELGGTASPEGGTLVTSGADNLETLLAREDAAGLPDGVPRLSRILPPLERRLRTTALAETLHAEQGVKQAELLGLGSLEPPPEPEPWTWEDIPEAAREAFVAGGSLVAQVPAAPAGPLPEGVAFCRPQASLAEALARWTREARFRLALAIAAMFAALLALRGRGAFAEILPPLAAMAAVGGGLGLAGAEVNLFHLLAFFLLAGMGVDYAVFLHGGGGAFKPAVCSLLTSMAGFGALAFVSLPVARAFGVVLGAGLPVAFVCAMAVSRKPEAEGPSTERCASPLGLEILYWIYRLFGLRAMHWAAEAVALSAWCGSHGVRRASPSPRKVAAFARSMADKLAVMAGGRGLRAVVPEDTEDMRAFVADVTAGRGVFVLSSHCGTVEVLPALGDCGRTFHAWMDFGRTSVFSAFYLRHARQGKVKLHPISGFGPESVFEAGDTLDAGDCLVMAGDSGGGRSLRVPFGGGTIELREGAFRLARALEHPAYFVACVEEDPGRYRAVARRLRGTAAGMARDYAETLHALVEANPEQWFRWEEADP